MSVTTGPTWISQWCPRHGVVEIWHSDHPAPPCRRWDETDGPREVGVEREVAAR